MSKTDKEAVKNSAPSSGLSRRSFLKGAGVGAAGLATDAEVLIQVSGTFGSRQEEAQRLGRVLRPKADGQSAHFYTLVSRETEEQSFAHHRQLFLTEQGYTYHIVDESDFNNS